MATSSAPGYLSKEFFQSALREGLKLNDVNVISLNIKLISEGGENYCSDIYRVKVRYCVAGEKGRNIALIVKDMKKNYAEGLLLPSKEFNMYQEVVPKMEEILGEGFQLTPKCFKATFEHDEVYVFEDLNELGYTLGDRLNGLDENEVHFVLEKIAIFHAASMILEKQHPDLIAKVGQSFFDDGLAGIPLLGDMIYSNLAHLKELLKQWDGFENVAVKLENLSANYDEKLIASHQTNKIRFKVLNHGDLWVNNIMFKYKKNTPVDMKFIDLQICNYMSPGYDLHYFFTTSIPLDLAIRKRYEFLRSYYRALKKTLTRLEYSPIPTWDDLLNEMRVTEFMSLQATVLSLPLICLQRDISKGNDLDFLKDAEKMKEQRIHMFESKRVLEALRYTLDRMNDLGILD